MVVCRRGMDKEALGVTDLSDLLIEENANSGSAALRFEHGDDVAGGPVAEELTERLLVIRDAMPLDQFDEVA